jgi:TrpR-related protein YerC/YecD
MKNWKTKEVKKLVQVIMAMKCENDLQDFLRDLLTLGELDDISRRWRVAELLNQGLTYREISKQTGHSTATVTKIAYWVNNGVGGYQKALEKVK